MPLHKRIGSVLFVVVASLLVLGLAAPAEAQKGACMTLVPGAAYVATMDITWEDNSGQDRWQQKTPPMVVGQTQCINFDRPREDFRRYFISLQPIEGYAVDCKNGWFDPGSGATFNFKAWGTLLDAHCQED